MKINKIFFVLVVAVLTMVACKEVEQPNVSSAFFVKRTAVGFYNEAKSIYTVNKSQDQLYFNKATNTFRIVSDSGTSYLEVVFNSSIPKMDEKVTASIKNNGLGKVENNSSIEFEVVKKDGENCWLWNQKTGLGLIIFFME